VYQEYFLAGTGGGRVVLKSYHLYVPTVLESGSLNLLEPYGPVKTCTGIASLLPYIFP